MQKTNKEFIKSLRREIERKKKELGVDSSISEMKELVRYANVESVKMPKSGRYQTNLTVEREDFYTSVELESLNYGFEKIIKNIIAFDKVVAAIAKKVSKDLKEVFLEGGMDALNEYIKINTGLTTLKVVNTEIEEITDEKTIKMLERVIFKALKTKECKIAFVEKQYYVDCQKQFDRYYTVLDTPMPKNKIGLWTNRDSRSRAQIGCLSYAIAALKLMKDGFEYILKNKDKMANILNKEFNFTEDFTAYNFIDDLVNIKHMIKVNEDNLRVNVFKEQMFLLNKAALCMVDEAQAIKNYEDNIKSLSSSYATSYMTKKNITKKIQGFMDNNNFLKMFGYVEADVDCDLDKLYQRETEFVELSKVLPMPVVSDHSLRFRKLGKLRAAGVFYPTFNTLCVDIDNVSSFVHEMFHMIDFSNGILSLSNEFNEIAELYKNITKAKIDSLEEDNPIRSKWNSKGKYNKSYYLDKAEIFARTGELYVLEILKIESSFSKEKAGLLNRDMNQIIYPTDESILKLIEKYFNNLMDVIKNKQIVNFDSSEPIVKTAMVESQTQVIDIDVIDVIADKKEDMFDEIVSESSVVEQLTLF